MFINPVLFLKYLRKFFFERVIFAFFRPPLHFVKNIRGVIFEADFKSFPQDKGFQECVKEIYFDTYEVEVREYMEKILKTGDIFVDVGASAGYLSAIGASLVKESGQVHCFEPAPILFQSLGKLPLKNPKYKIIVNNCALGDKTGTIKFNYAAFPSLGGSSIVPGFLEFHHISKVQTIDVPIMRLDEYLQKNKLERVALIKIDVEGVEKEVLEGGINTLRDKIDNVFIEISPLRKPPDSSDYLEVFKMLHNCGFAFIDVSVDFFFSKDKDVINYYWGL